MDGFYWASWVILTIALIVSGSAVIFLTLGLFAVGFRLRDGLEHFPLILLLASSVFVLTTAISFLIRQGEAVLFNFELCSFYVRFGQFFFVLSKACIFVFAIWRVRVVDLANNHKGICYLMYSLTFAFLVNGMFIVFDHQFVRTILQTFPKSGGQMACMTKSHPVPPALAFVLEMTVQVLSVYSFLKPLRDHLKNLESTGSAEELRQVLRRNLRGAIISVVATSLLYVYIFIQQATSLGYLGTTVNLPAVACLDAVISLVCMLYIYHKSWMLTTKMKMFIHRRQGSSAPEYQPTTPSNITNVPHA